MKVAVFSTQSYDQQYFEKINQQKGHSLTFLDAPLHVNTSNLAQGFEAVCVFVNDQVDKETIATLAKNGVKLIALRCTGFNNVDIETAQENGIKVVHVPAYSPHAVAEHSVSLILTLNRKTHKAYNRIREHNFSLERLTGFNLFDKTVGVIGTGNIGSVFGKIMLGFGCRVIAFDHYPDESLKSSGIVYHSFEELLRKSDIISLHCPLTPETRYMINQDGFSMMQAGAMLINTSRGALMDTTAAIDALKSGKLGYLGIDVYEQEEKLFFKDLSESIIQDDMIARLITFPNVLVTAHQGFFTEEALEQIAHTTLDNITAIERKNSCENEVTVEHISYSNNK